MGRCGLWQPLMSNLHLKAVRICDGQDHMGVCGPGELEVPELYARKPYLCPIPNHPYQEVKQNKTKTKQSKNSPPVLFGPTLAPVGLKSQKRDDRY